MREFLQRRWDIYNSFDPKFREALETQNLDKVNKVLGDVPVPEAEKLVEMLQESGVLSFRSTEVGIH